MSLLGVAAVFPPTSPQHATTWMVWGGGALLIHRRTRRLGAALWLVNGMAALGIAWERLCGSDMTRLADGSADWHAGLLAVWRHLPQLVGGAVLLRLIR